MSKIEELGKLIINRADTPSFPALAILDLLAEHGEKIERHTERIDALADIAADHEQKIGDIYKKLDVHYKVFTGQECRLDDIERRQAAMIGKSVGPGTWADGFACGKVHRDKPSDPPRDAITDRLNGHSGTLTKLNNRIQELESIIKSLLPKQNIKWTQEMVDAFNGIGAMTPEIHDVCCRCGKCQNRRANLNAQCPVCGKYGCGSGQHLFVSPETDVSPTAKANEPPQFEGYEWVRDNNVIFDGDYRLNSEGNLVPWSKSMVTGTHGEIEFAENYHIYRRTESRRRE